MLKYVHNAATKRDKCWNMFTMQPLKETMLKYVHNHLIKSSSTEVMAGVVFLL